MAAIRPVPSGGGSGAAALPPSDLTIVQSASQLSISRKPFDEVVTATYDLGGAESKNRSGAVTRITRAHWDGPRLVIEGKASQVTSAGYSAWTLKEVYSFDAKGRLLIEIEQIYDDGSARKSVQELVKKR